MKILEYNIYHQENDNDSVHIDERQNANKRLQEMRSDLIEELENKNKRFFLPL
jgi:hypothetical protein